MMDEVEVEIKPAYWKLLGKSNLLHRGGSEIFRKADLATSAFL